MYIAISVVFYASATFTPLNPSVPYLGTSGRDILTSIGAYPLRKTQTDLCDYIKDICSRSN
jgi:hypothetical protein